LLQRQLKTIGYSVDETGAFDDATQLVLKAFQRRFRPARIDGLADEETQMLLMALGWGV
jgi:N-acetyl-anhydromuramyl-L-alanine amidase AmpD